MKVSDSVIWTKLYIWKGWFSCTGNDLLKRSSDLSNHVETRRKLDLKQVTLLFIRFLTITLVLFQYDLLNRWSLLNLDYVYTIADSFCAGALKTFLERSSVHT